MPEEKKEKAPDKTDDELRKERKEERELLRGELKEELSIITKNRIFVALLKLVDRKLNEHITIDKIKPDKDAASQYYFCKGVVDLARKIKGFLKDVENGTVNFHVWDETEKGRNGGSSKTQL
jgi:hypothetical protein